MAADVKVTVQYCAKCAKDIVRLRKRTKNMKLFPGYEPFSGVVFGIPWPLIKFINGRRFLLVITDRF